MKVSMARIRLYLKEGKTLANGTHPIMLMVSFNGRKEISTGFSCTTRFWDKTSECVKKGFPNYSGINAAINKLKNDAIATRNEYERLEKPYTPDMILSKKNVAVPTSNIDSLIDNYIEEKGLRRTTSYDWKWLKRKLKENNMNDMVSITLDDIRKFANSLKSSGINDGAVRKLISKINALCRYAVEKNIIDSNPMKEWHYTRQFKSSSKMLYIHYSTIEIMKEYIMNLMIDRQGDLWSYKDGVIEQLNKRHSDLFSIYFYMLDYIFQGLSPIDLALIELKDIEIKSVNGNQYYAYDTKRMKTSVHVKIRIKKGVSIFVEMMMGLRMFRNRYLLPFFDGDLNASLDKKKGMVSYSLTRLRPKLKKHFEKINEIVIQHNVDNDDSIPLIDMNCNYYSCRHSYSMNYMMKGGTPMALATLLGRSPNTLAQYISELTEETDLAIAVDVV